MLVKSWCSGQQARSIRSTTPFFCLKYFWDVIQDSSGDVLEAGIHRGLTLSSDVLYADNCTFTANTPEKLQKKLEFVKLLFASLWNWMSGNHWSWCQDQKNRDEDPSGGVASWWDSNRGDRVSISFEIPLACCWNLWYFGAKADDSKAYFAHQGLIKEQDVYAPDPKLCLIDNHAQPAMSFVCKILGI